MKLNAFDLQNQQKTTGRFELVGDRNIMILQTNKREPL